MSRSRKKMGASTKNRYSCYKSIADKYGFNAAMLFGYIEFWCNGHDGRSAYYYDGSTWVYKTIDGFMSVYPCLGRRQIATALDKLVKDGLIAKAHFVGGIGGNATYYTITAKGVEMANYTPKRTEVSHKTRTNSGTKCADNVQNVQELCTKRTEGIAQNVQKVLHGSVVSSYIINKHNYKHYYNHHYNSDVEEKDDERNEGNDEGNPFGDCDDSPPPMTVQRYAAENLVSLGYRAMQELNSFVEDMGEDVVRHAIDNALDNGVRTWKYINTILNNYMDADVKTVAQAKAYDEEWKRRKAEKQGGNQGDGKSNREHGLFGDFY